MLAAVPLHESSATSARRISP